MRRPPEKQLDQGERAVVGELLGRVRHGTLSRREFVVRTAALGVSLSSAGQRERFAGPGERLDALPQGFVQR